MYFVELSGFLFSDFSGSPLKHVARARPPKGVWSLGISDPLGFPRGCKNGRKRSTYPTRWAPNDRFKWGYMWPIEMSKYE